MNLKAGIIGLPNVGKSSLFAALTNSNVEIANYPFATIEPNIATVEIRDPRLISLAELVLPEKVVFPTYSFVDIAGLIKGAAAGEGLGNKFLANIRSVDCLVHVVRCFQNSEIVHVNNEINPISDVEVVNFELILADLATIDTVIARLNRKIKNVSEKTVKIELELAQKVKKHLELGKPARSLKLNFEENLILKNWQLLSSKKVLYVANLDQESIQKPQENRYFQELSRYLEAEKSKLIPLSIAFEQEISQLEAEEKKLFLSEFGIEKSSLDLLILHSFYLLDLATFFTVGKKEVRGWVFKNNTTAQDASGIIHSDFRKKFIRVEIITYEDFVASGNEKTAKEKGKMRLEGKDYLLKDGEICHFRIAS